VVTEKESPDPLRGVLTMLIIKAYTRGIEAVTRHYLIGKNKFYFRENLDILRERVASLKI
jgi:hypothetical protein